MKTFKLNHLALLMAGTVISSASFADGGQAEAGPTKAAKESVAFVDYLDREEVFGGKFSTWVEFASDYVFRIRD